MRVFVLQTNNRQEINKKKKYKILLIPKPEQEKKQAKINTYKSLMSKGTLYKE